MTSIDQTGSASDLIKMPSQTNANTAIPASLDRSVAGLAEIADTKEPFLDIVPRDSGSFGVNPGQATKRRNFHTTASRGSEGFRIPASKKTHKFQLNRRADSRSVDSEVKKEASGGIGLAPFPEKLFDNLDADRLVDTHEAAKILGVSVNTLRKWRFQGRVDAVTVGPKLVRYHVRTLLRQALTKGVPNGMD